MKLIKSISLKERDLMNKTDLLTPYKLII